MAHSVIPEEVTTSTGEYGDNNTREVPDREVDDDDVEGEKDSEEKSITSNKYCIDYSKRGTAKCKVCKKIIQKGELRTGMYAHFRDRKIINYFHVQCFFGKIRRARTEANVIKCSSDIDGYESILAEDKILISNQIQEVEEYRRLREEGKITDVKRTHHMTKQVTPAARKRKLVTRTEPAIKIMYTNADQLTTGKKDELVARIEKEKPTIIAVTEVKPKNHAKERAKIDYEIENYTLHSTNLLNTDPGRGIAVFTHKSIEKSIAEITTDVKFEECCLIEIRLRGGDTMLFACCYRSPTQSAISNENNEKLNQLLRIIANKKYSHRCVVGDFNYKDINWTSWTTEHGEESKEQMFIDTIRDCFFFQHIQQATRSRGDDQPSTLDLIFTDEEMQISEVKHLAPLGKSDHGMIIFDFHCYLDYSKPKISFLYDKGDFTGMRDSLERSDWVEEFKKLAVKSDVELLWANMKGKFKELRGTFVPQKSTSNLCWKAKFQTPLRKITRKAIKEKTILHRKMMSTFMAADKQQQARLKYAKARNRVKALVRKDKRDLERKIALEAKSKPKLFWSHTRRKLRTKVGVAPLLENKQDKNSLVFDDEKKANLLQKQFSSVYTKEPLENIPSVQLRTGNKVIHVEIKPEAVNKKLKSLNTNKSCGPDDLHPRLLSELADIISEPLAIILNLSIATRAIPKEWKLANVVPVFKKGSKSLAENYRPISLTCVLCRVMESFLKDSIMEHLLKNNLLSPRQHGFISGRSTVTQLLAYLDSCVRSIANGNVVDVVYLDFQKAFDTVPHSRLIKKLQAYGIDGKLLDWVAEYLKNRNQVVTVNGESSLVGDVLSGIPQGTVLGPLLFIIYINDILDDVDSEGLLFADDAKIFRTVTCKDDALLLQQDISQLEAWSDKWLLKFHPDKCKLLTLGKLENIKYCHRYKVSGQEIEHMFEEKDLGVTMDSELTFAEHITEKVNKANSLVGIIRRSFSRLDKDTFVKIFVAFVRPHLEYGQVIWAPHLRKYINMIEKVQIRATKLIDGFGKLSYSERLGKLNLPTLAYRRLRGDMIETYKHFHSYDPTILPPSFIRRDRPSRSHDFQIQPIIPKDGERGVQKNSFYCRIADTWNQLPRDVVIAPTMDAFKNRLDKHWKDLPLKLDHTASQQRQADV